MVSVSRRKLLTGAAAVALSPIAPTAQANDQERFAGCGCINPRPQDEFGECLTHDKHGRRWDAYTEDEVLALLGYTEKDIYIVGPDDEALCCNYGPETVNNGRTFFEANRNMPIGTKMAGCVSGYYEPEYDEKCAACHRAEWLTIQTTDWYALAYEDGARSKQAPPA